MAGDLELIPVINKIDLPSADPEGVKEQIEQVIGLDASDAILTSAKGTLAKTIFGTLKLGF